MTFPFAQVIALGLMSISMLHVAFKDGETKKPEKHNFKASLVVSVLNILLLGWGGFWQPLNYFWR